MRRAERESVMGSGEKDTVRPRLGRVAEMLIDSGLDVDCVYALRDSWMGAMTVEDQKGSNGSDMRFDRSNSQDVTDSKWQVVK